VAEFSALADAFRPDFILADLTRDGTLPPSRDVWAWATCRALLRASDLVLVDDEQLRTALREHASNVDSVPDGGVDSILDMLERQWTPPS
jgi:hypothetical protein